MDENTDEPAIEAADSPSLSQEPVVEIETLPKTMSLIGTAPIVCENCDSILFTKDLTDCPLCGASPVSKAAIVHYAQPCDAKFHDRRFLAGQSSVFKTGCFQVPCQPSGVGQRPRHLTPALDAVTCPRCLHELGAEIDTNGRLVNI